jgi:ribonuclease BN (tRNA processing enzyme)
LSDIKVTTLGSSGSFAGPGGACTGYLVEAGGAKVWLDAGPGTLANLQCHCGLEDLDAIVLTHEHPDHWLELPVAFNALKFFVERSGLPVYGTAPNKVLAMALNHDPLEPILDWRITADGSTTRIGDQNWSFSRTDHYVETLAIRVDVNGTSFGFSSDTGPGWELADLGPGLDLALCEASFLADKESAGVLHLSARQAGATAKDADVGQLVITHVAPNVDAAASVVEASEAFGAAVGLAEVGAVFEV